MTRTYPAHFPRAYLHPPASPSWWPLTFLPTPSGLSGYRAPPVLSISCSPLLPGSLPTGGMGAAQELGEAWPGQVSMSLGSGVWALFSPRPRLVAADPGLCLRPPSSASPMSFGFTHLGTPGLPRPLRRPWGVFLLRKDGVGEGLSQDPCCVPSGPVSAGGKGLAVPACPRPCSCPPQLKPEAFRWPGPGGLATRWVLQPTPVRPPCAAWPQPDPVAALGWPCHLLDLLSRSCCPFSGTCRSLQLVPCPRVTRSLSC